MKRSKVTLTYSRNRNSHTLYAEICESFQDSGDLAEERISAYECLIDLIRDQIRKVGKE